MNGTVPAFSISCCPDPQSARRGGDVQGADPRTAYSTNNLLNQITGRTVPGYVLMYPARPYNPSTGRFLTHDPIGEDGSDNLYSFAKEPMMPFDNFMIHIVRVAKSWLGCRGTSMR